MLRSLKAGIVCAVMIFACAAPALADPPMKFQVIGGLFGVLAEGEITSNTPKELSAFLRNNTAALHILVFNSGGGDLDAGLEMGRLIRRAGWDTSIGTPGLSVLSAKRGECSSACTFAFIVGSRRSIAPFSRFGVHRYWGTTPGDEQETQKTAGKLVAYIHEMGVSDEMYTLMTKAGIGDPKDEFVKYLDPSTMMRLNITTSEVVEAKMTDVQGVSVLRLTDTDSGGGITYGKIDLYCNGPRLFARASFLNPLGAFNPSQLSIAWTFSPEFLPRVPVPRGGFRYLGKEEGKLDIDVDVSMTPSVLDWILLAKSISLELTGPSTWKPFETEEDRVGGSANAIPDTFSTLVQTLTKSCR